MARSVMPIGAVFVVAVMGLLGCGDSGTAEPDGAVPGPDGPANPVLTPLNPEELNGQLANKDFLLICVHVPRYGEVPGTDTHISYLDIDGLVQYIGLDLGRKVVIYCLTNHMADIAGNELLARGYWNIFYLDGGMLAWEAAGLPLDP